MAINFCLPKEYTDKFLQALKSGEITPDKLNDFQTSEERRAFLTPYVGKENAQSVNALIESKLLLKNWKLGLVDAVKAIAGLKPETKTDLVTKIEKMEKYLTPTEQNKFYEDIAAQKLGTEVTLDEAQRITEQTKAIKEKKDKFRDDPSEENRIDMGVDMVELIDYVKSLNPSNKSLVQDLLNLPRSLMATADLSAFLRQGWGVITNPVAWKNAPNMLRYAGSGLFNTDYYKKLQADLLTRPNAELMKKAGLRLSVLDRDISQREEDFTSRVFEKVPVLGRVFKGSEFAYSGFLSKVRADMFDRLIEAARLNGEDVGMKSNVPRDIASIVNTLTGSGNVGVNDRWATAVPLLNAIFFAPRKISAAINILNPLTYVDPRTSPTARKAAIRNVVGSIGATAAVLALASLLGDDDTVETDPRSSDFGKIRVNNTRYDLSGGNAGYLTLLARIFTQSTKSSTTGAVRKLGEGYKATTGDQLAFEFIANKFAPILSFARTMARGKGFGGEELNVPKEVLSRFTPLVAQDIIKVAKDDATQVFPAIMAGIMGIGIGNYTSQSNRDSAIKDTYEKYGTGNIEQATKEIFTTLEKDSGKPLTPAQKTNIKKQYGIYRKFGGNEDLLDKALEIFDARTNDDRVEILKKLKTEDPALYREILNQGRTTIITDKGTKVPVLISDDLYKLLTKK